MHRLASLLTLFVMFVTLAAGSTVPTISAQQPACPELVKNAFQVIQVVCDDTSSNQACYAHDKLNAIPQPHVQSLIFNQAGDIVDVADVRSLRLSPMDLASSWWGVGLIRLRTNMTNVNARGTASILLFGNVTVDNAVQSPTVTREFTIHSTGGANVRVRMAPYDGLVIAALPNGQAVTGTGRTEDGWWVRIELPDTQRPGWVHANLLAEPAAITDLDVVEANAAEYAPMQAFTFTSAQNDAVCSEAPNSGLMVQTPEGEAKVTFLINEVNISLGSTAFIQAVTGNNMAIYLVEGASQITARNVSYGMVAGTMITVPLNDDGFASGPPSLPAAYDPADLAGLPVEYLDRPVRIAPPLNEAALAQLVAANLSSDDPDDDAESDAEDVVEVEGGDPGVGGNNGGGNAASEKKITICHKGHTITIGESAWPAHQAHGDTMGSCPEG